MFSKIKYKSVFVWLVALLISVITAGYFFPYIVAAEQSAPDTTVGKSSKSEIIFKKIQPPPEFNAGSIVESRRIQDFFDAMGNVTVIEKDFIVLGDREYKFAKGLRVAGVQKWDHVGLRLNKKGEVVAYEKLKNEPH